MTTLLLLKVLGKPIPQLEEALEQIQGSDVTSLSNRSPKYCRTMDFPLASAVTRIGSRYQNHHSDEVNFNEEMPENKANLDFDRVLFQQNLEETQRLLEDQHLSSLQHVHQEVNHPINSETLSSVDSLEAGEHNEIYETLTKAPSFSTKWNSISRDSQSPQSRDQSCFGSDEMTLSKMRHVNNWLTNLGDENPQAATPFDAILIKPSVLTPSEHLNHREQNSPAPTGCGQRLTADTASSGNGPGTFKRGKNKEKNSEPSTTWKADSLSSGMFKRERPYITVSPTFQSRKPSITLTTPTREAVQISDSEGNTEFSQRRRTVAHASNPPATPLIVPVGQWSDCTDTYNSTCTISSLRKNVHIQGTHAMQCADYLGYNDEKVQDFEGNEREGPFSVPDSPSASDVFSKPNQPERKEQNDTGMAVSSPSSGTSLSDLVEQHKKMNQSSHERNGVCLLKSILKKESKYENDYFKALVVNRGICFGNQTAASIRDSVELTKVKGRGSESQKVSKKLRWFDEISKRGIEDEDKGLKKNQTGLTPVLSSPSCVSMEVSAANNTRSSPHGTLSSAGSETPKGDPLTIPRTASIKESEKDHVPLNSLVPSGYRFAKQAWLASKSAAGKLSVSAEETKSPKSSPRRGKLKVIRRARYAKGPSAFTCKSRKGAVIRPQSARDTNRVIQTQGKILIPHPPPPLTSISRMGKNALDSPCQPVKCPESQKNASHPYLHSKWDSSPKHMVSLGIQESGPSLWNNTCTSDLATVMPFRPSSSISEGKILAKTNHPTTSALQEAHDSPVYEESCPKLDHTPTEDEIALLWKGVHSALAQNENIAGDLQQGDEAHYSNSYLTDLPASEPSLSRVNIHGGTTLKNLKFNSTRNGTFSSSSSDSTVTRRKQNLDSGDNKLRGFAEQRRETSSSKGKKFSDRGQNSEHPVKPSPLHCAFEPVQTSRVISNAEEVSESTAQFLLAENLVKSSAPEEEILIAMETVQPQKPTTTLNKTRQSNINALSFEEQKILQSLECLNQRLQDVQGIICKNPSIKSILQLASPLKSQPWTTSLPVDQRIPTYARSRLQRKY
ncbi:centrosomal protein of 126 kDa isoform X2 [Ornithorhynchus anatinus]|uniref:centrosomal protein of 126 kDa isoform X2 n=1 Tax=Ornithorhynchus anatinus TaxID=9258 RepID=UPI0010A901E0|nr:centrosomal protein of 126 kDa isoform X2 [Ornithorhynchus anatinus]XP_028903904.1 centrosomal protein of 126 kDa isoform X2 [Ornithorhynchus anatinus]